MISLNTLKILLIAAGIISAIICTVFAVKVKGIASKMRRILIIPIILLSLIIINNIVLYYSDIEYIGGNKIEHLKSITTNSKDEYIVSTEDKTYTLTEYQYADSYYVLLNTKIEYNTPFKFTVYDYKDVLFIIPSDAPDMADMSESEKQYYTRKNRGNKFGF